MIRFAQLVAGGGLLGLAASFLCEALHPTTAAVFLIAGVYLTARGAAS